MSELGLGFVSRWTLPPFEPTEWIGPAPRLDRLKYTVLPSADHVGERSTACEPGIVSFR
jgi:hypothetical protein